MQDQLGLTVVDSKPVGLAGSGGSTPLRLRIAGDPDTYLFGKLYAMNHVRADRWYKLGRTILYGNLEDETPFKSVRQLIQHEDYAMRLLGDAGLPTARSVGIVELTPDREYLLVTEFFDGAEEIGDAEVDDQIIDEGLALVRQLWNAGVAHRDIKPANLLVKDGHLHVIDVAFAQVRPSPWREAVDLANMMLVLAVRTDPERVYRARPRLLHPRRDRRGVRRCPGHRQPDAAARDAQEGRSRPRHPVPPPRPATPADLAATLGTAPHHSRARPARRLAAVHPERVRDVHPRRTATQRPWAAGRDQAARRAAPTT